MPLLESESLVLKTYNLAEADRIVVFFTRDFGIVRGVAKGAKRLKSKFGSTLEPFSTVNLTYFQKEERELVSVQQVELTRSKFDTASDPAFLQTFSYLAELLVSIIPPHDPNQTIYRMIQACLQANPSGEADFAAVRLYFELWLLRLGGYMPDWAACGECSRTFSPDETAALRHDNHIICERCRRGQRMTPVLPIQRQLFNDAQRLGPEKFIESSKQNSQTTQDLSSVLRRIIVQVIGREITIEQALAVNT